MKKLIITLIIAISAALSATANEQDTLWFRIAGAGVQDLDFTPDDKYVIAWTNAIEFWNVETATMDFIVPNIKVGGMTSDEKYLVFIQDGVPKMLDIETKEIIGGFEPPTFKPNNVKVGHDSNIFMCSNEKDSLFIWDIETKKIVKVFSKLPDFIENGDEFVRKITDYGFAGNNDDFIFISTLEENKYDSGHPNKIYRGASLFYNRNDLTLFDSLAWIGKYKPMNLNKDEIAIDNYDGTISLYNVRDKKTIKSIKYDVNLYAEDLEFSNDDNILGIVRGYTIPTVFKLFRITDNKLIFEFNKNNASWNQFKISNNQNKMVASIGSFLIMYNNQWVVPTGVNNIESENILLLTPNPSNFSIHISYEFPIITTYKLSLYDVLGNLVTVIDEKLLNNLNYNKDFNISFLSKGVYFVRLEYDGKTVNKQFVKE